MGGPIKPYDPFDPSTWGNPGGPRGTTVTTTAPTQPSARAPGAAPDAPAITPPPLDPNIHADPEESRYALQQSADYWVMVRKSGLIDSAEFFRHLVDEVGYNENMARMYMQVVDQEIAKSQAAGGSGLTTSEIMTAKRLGIITSEKAQEFFTLNHKNTPGAVGVLMALMEGGEKGKETSESQVAALVQGKKISVAEGVRRLIDMGYNAKDAQDLISLSTPTGGVNPDDPYGVKKAALGYTGQPAPQATPQMRPAATAQGAPSRQNIPRSGPGGQLPSPVAPISSPMGRSARASGSAPNMANQYSKAFQAGIGSMFHAGAIDPLAAHWALNNQDMFFAKHLGAGGVGDGLPTAAEINVMYQGMQFAPRQRGAEPGAAAAPQEAM